MIIGIGTDLLDIKRVNRILENKHSIFLAKTYTREEHKQATFSSNSNHYYATRFAGKEAIFKTLSIVGNHVNLRDIEILNNEAGIPYVQVSGRIREVGKTMGIEEFKISFSSDGDYVLAFAIAHSY
ncbi:holo-ACP synthase [Enterococcus raffinosus]|uniref:holo-ACP synthase n=1 Tax=Enterococcus raffinosus TaxID=71452 RepID=UPI001C103A1E|nr:holo-ACP synthase [Enterococcus raffinosus]MBU5362550.1 holo-ACP synthase [Enterococcus raffinosus]